MTRLTVNHGDVSENHAHARLAVRDLILLLSFRSRVVFVNVYAHDSYGLAHLNRNGRRLWVSLERIGQKGGH